MGSLFLLLLVARQGAAQYLNRAIFLGPESEGVRSNFNQNRRYFVNRFSYVEPAPWWKKDLNPFMAGVYWSGGSVSSSQFTLEGHINATAELGEKFRFHFHALQSETQDNRFLRNAIEFQYLLDESVALFVMSEFIADKRKNDISFGVQLFRRPERELRFMLTAVDVSSEKNRDEFDYVKRGFGLMSSGFFGAPGGDQLRFEFGVQLPFELRDVEQGQNLDFARYQAMLEGRWKLNDKDWLVASIEYELSNKSLRSDSSADPLREEFDQNLQIARVEWWRRLEHDHELAAGILAVHKTGTGRRPNDPARSLHLKRNEIYGFARYRLPLSEKVAFEPEIYAGMAKFDEVFGNDGPDTRRFRGFQGKWATPLVFDFDEKSRMKLNLSFELDELSFAGGSIQFELVF